jgi:hypothetical protein
MTEREPEPTRHPAPSRRRHRHHRALRSRRGSRSPVGPSQHKALAGGFAHLPEARQRDGARLVRSVALPVAGEVEPDLHPVDRRLRRG